MEFLEKYLKNILLVGIFLVPFIVFIVDYSELFPFITGKNFAFRVLIEVLFGVWLMISFLNEKYRPKKSLLLFAITAFVVIMFVADLFGVETKQSFWSNYERMDGWVTLIHLWAYFLVLGSVLRTKQIWNYFWHTTVITSVGVGLFAVAQYIREYFVETKGLAAEGILKVLPIINQGGERLDATFGNATYLAVYMLLHIFITIFLFWRYRKSSWKLKSFYIVALLLQIFSLYHTGTRGSILGLILGFVMAAIFFVIFEKKDSVFRKSSLVFLGLLAVLIIGLVSIRNTDFVKNQRTLHRLTSISFEDKTTKARFLLWDLAFEGVKEKPVLGYGQGNFNYVFDKYYNPELYDQEPWFDRAHNVVFDWLVAGGFLGFLSYAFIFFALIKLIWKSKEFSRKEKIIFFSMVSAYVFQNLFVFDQITSYIIFFAFLAYIHSMESEKPIGERIFNLDKGTRDRIVIPLILILTLIIPYAVNAKGYLQSRTAIKAMNIPQAQTIEELNYNTAESLRLFKKSVSYDTFGNAEVRERISDVTRQVIQVQQVDPGLRQQFLIYAKTELKKQIEENPQDARYRLLAGDFLMRVGFYEEAENHIKKAIEISPKKQVLYTQWAQIHNLVGNNEKVVEITKEGYLIYPDNDDAWNAYMISLDIAGKDKEYDSLLKEALNKEQYGRLARLLYLQATQNPDSPEYRYNLAVVYSKWGLKDRVITQLRVLESKFPDQFKNIVPDLIKKVQNGETLAL